MKKIDILYTVDGNYFIHFLTSVYSLLENNKECFICLHVIEDNLKLSDRYLLDELVSRYNQVELKVYNWDPLSEKYIIPKWRGTDIANARLFSREILKDVDRVLYLDSDTIVDNSIVSLFERESFTPVGAVLDFNVPYHLKGLVDNYFNSGVLFFNYKLWDREDCTKTIYDTFKKNTIPLVFPDQDLLNLSLSDRIEILNMNYNITPLIYDMVKYPFFTKKTLTKKNYYSFEKIVDTSNNPIIYHMLTYFNERPWDFNNNHPFNQVYQYYRRSLDPSFESVSNGNHDLFVGFMGYVNMMFNSFLPDSINYEIKDRVRKLYKKV